MLSEGSSPVIYLVDDDKSVLKTLPRALELYGYTVRSFATAKDFLAGFDGEHGCLLLDLSLPVMNGLELQDELAKLKINIPIVFITGHGGVTDSVRALRHGAVDFLLKPFRTEKLIESINEALEIDSVNRARLAKDNDIQRRIAKLTDRERNVFDLLVLDNEPPSSKVMARKLGISHRTVEHHRSRVLEKLAAGSVVELRLTIGKTLGAQWL